MNCYRVPITTELYKVDAEETGVTMEVATIDFHIIATTKHTATIAAFNRAVDNGYKVLDMYEPQFVDEVRA
jgi:hypothetical protein